MRRAALLALLLVPLATGCDPEYPVTCTGSAPRVESRPADDARANVATLRLSDLADGWTPHRPGQPLGLLRPPLEGLVETGRAESPVFVRQGIALRSSTSVFATAADAAEAFRRAGTRDFGRCLSAQLRGVALARERTPGTLLYRITTGRLADPGFDRVTVILAREDRTLLVLEAVHGRDLRRELDRALLELLERL